MRQQLSEDIFILLKDFLDKNLTESYYRFYEGIVVNNNDPDKLGRCKVRVMGIFSDSITDDDLPWALPDFSFIGGKSGSFIVPHINTLVNVYFERGDIYLPHYTTKIIDKQNLPEERLIDYPDTMVLMKTDEGDVWEMNRKTKRLLFTHNSGTKIEIDKDGNVDILVKGNETKTVNKNMSAFVKGDSLEDVTGYINKKAKTGNITIEQTTSLAKIEISNSGNIDITQGPLGSINIGGVKAQLFCPDLQVCPITGSPLSILTKIPGMMVKVP
jgi:uncharacterized protein involved in type VI secretion and phage assembly